MSNHDNARRTERKRTETGAKPCENGSCGSRRQKMHSRRDGKHKHSKSMRQEEKERARLGTEQLVRRTRYGTRTRMRKNSNRVSGPDRKAGRAWRRRLRLRLEAAAA